MLCAFTLILKVVRNFATQESNNNNFIINL